MGGKVDPKFYIPEDYSCVDQDAFTKVTVGRRASLRLPFHITDSGTTLRLLRVHEYLINKKINKNSNIK